MEERDLTVLRIEMAERSTVCGMRGSRRFEYSVWVYICLTSLLIQPPSTSHNGQQNLQLFSHPFSGNWEYGWPQTGFIYFD